MAVREGDAATWLHNKLGSTDDLWSGSTICSQLTRERLLSIHDCFHNLQPHVKVKLLLSFLHIPKRNVEEWKIELEEIIQLALNDSDQWVTIIGDILKTYPATGSLNCDVDECHTFFHEVINDVKKLVKKCQDVVMLPMECPYLSRSALLSIAGQQSQPVKHFALKRKPKSAALRADLLQKSAEVASNSKRFSGTTVPVKIRSFAKKMDDTTPLRGIPSSKQPQSGGFIRSSSLAGRFGLTLPMGQNRSSSAHKEGGIKLLDIAEQPIGSKEAKRRKKQAEQELQDQQKKAENTSTTAMPDYAAGLLVSGLDDIPSCIANTQSLTYLPITATSKDAAKGILASAEDDNDSAFAGLSTSQTVVPSRTTNSQSGTSSASSSVKILVPRTTSTTASAINIIQLRPAVPSPAMSLAAASAVGTVPATQTLQAVSSNQQVTVRTTEQLRLTRPGAEIIQSPVCPVSGSTVPTAAAPSAASMLVRQGTAMVTTGTVLPSGTLLPAGTTMVQAGTILPGNTTVIRPGTLSQQNTAALLKRGTLLPSGAIQLGSIPAGTQLVQTSGGTQLVRAAGTQLVQTSTGTQIIRAAGTQLIQTSTGIQLVRPAGAQLIQTSSGTQIFQAGTPVLPSGMHLVQTSAGPQLIQPSTQLVQNGSGQTTAIRAGTIPANFLKSGTLPVGIVRPSTGGTITQTVVPMQQPGSSNALLQPAQPGTVQTAGVLQGGARLLQPSTLLVRPSVSAAAGPVGQQQSLIRLGVNQPVSISLDRSHPAVATQSSTAPTAPQQMTAGQPSLPKPGLSLTREQMLEAQEMFKNSNKVTRPEKAIILGFMAGSRENPCPNQGDIINIRLSEVVDTVQTPEGIFRPTIIETYFQMNYATGESKRIIKMRDKEPEAE